MPINNNRTMLIIVLLLIVIIITTIIIIIIIIANKMKPQFSNLKSAADSVVPLVCALCQWQQRESPTERLPAARHGRRGENKQ